MLFRSVVSLFTYEGIKRVPVQSASVGDIVCVSGIDGVMIGDSLCSESDVKPIEFVKIAEPSEIGRASCRERV